MDRRYQVFVSSTYKDLVEERQEVIMALLELDCIPSGMELFPAADDDQWTLIKKVIDDCDYYIVIIAGRYGSIGPEGKSYTQMEYEYAVSKGKPTIAFLHSEPNSLRADRVEQTDSGKQALAKFKELVERKLCKTWTSAKDLGGVVSRSIVHLVKTKPGVGWVRADSLPDAAAMLLLRERVSKLEQSLENSKELTAAGILRVTTSPYNEVDWKSLFLSTNRLDIFFAYARTWRNSHIPELENLARRHGATIRLVLPDPTADDLVAELARRFACTIAELRERIREAQEHFIGLRTIPGSVATIDVWHLPTTPQFTYYIFERSAVISLYAHRRQRVGVITMVLTTGILYDYICTEFEAFVHQAEGLATKITGGSPLED